MSISQEQFFYNKIYKNKIIILKIGGTELASISFAKTIKQIKKLANKGIKFIIVFGGGIQIDKEWAKNNSNPRPKKNGIGITTIDVLDKAVLPAYENIVKYLKKEFRKETYFFNKKDVICNYKNRAKFGEVGQIRKINIPKKIAKINVIGFVGQLKNNKYVNINADEIVSSLLVSIKSIIEVIFLTPTGCVLDKNDRRVGLITNKTLDQIIKGKDVNIIAQDGMLQKLKEIKKLLPKIPKIAITNLDSLAQEIETWQGAGTLILDLNQHKISKIAEYEKAIVKKILLFHKKDDKTFCWNKNEFDDILDHHYIFKIKDSPLGGFSFFQMQDKIIIKALWSDYVSIEIIDSVIKYIKSMTRKENKKIFVQTNNKKICEILAKNKIKFVSL